MWMPKVAGGTDFIHKVFESLNVPSVKTQITIDTHGYDGFAALACIEEGLLNVSKVFTESKNLWIVLALF